MMTRISSVMNQLTFAVYAARRTMPNGLVFPSIRGDGHVIGSA
jgi:hypothetical protein